jgi:glutathione S-transferase
MLAAALDCVVRVILYEDATSGNCLKCRLLLRELGLPFRSVAVDLFLGETRTPAHFARNPDGRIPVLELDSGETIAESGAILLYLAEGSELLPADRLQRAFVHQWMFFEQNRIEAELAVARFLRLSGREATLPDAFAHRLARGIDALETLERGLSDGRDFIIGERFTVADIALYGYVHCADEAGAAPRSHPHLAAWLARIEARPGFVNDLAPFPAYAAQRPI